MRRSDVEDTDRCQACLTSQAASRISCGDSDSHFALCKACARRLEHLALRPLEWYRLAALHGPTCYPLHDDFYDEDGTAEQNRIQVEHATLFPVPKLDAVVDNLPALLDYTITRSILRDDVVDALKSHPSAKVLEAIKILAETRSNPWVEGRCYEVAAQVLREFAAEWIDTRWNLGTRSDTWFPFMEAAVRCLPPPETVPRALLALEKVESMPRSRAARALAPFGSPVVLDWMERHVTPPVSEDWGWLAARSGFSWPIACRWLDSGRPLSLVALDALKTLVPAGRSSAIESGLPPGELHDRPSTQVLIETLQAYAAVDPMPRVTLAVASIERYARSDPSAPLKI